MKLTKTVLLVFFLSLPILSTSVVSANTWAEEAKLIASDGESDDVFGISVAADGDTVIIGAHGDADNGNDSGSAYVFTRSGTTWIEQAKLIPSDSAVNDNFGWSVAIDGDTALIGAFNDGFSGARFGSAYIFTRSGTTWSQQAKLIASDGERNDWFGYSVALSGDTVVIGADSDDDNGFNSGSAYVFTRSGTTWSEQAKLTASDAASMDLFGISVAVDGDTAIISARDDDDDGTNSGSVYVFTRSGTIWSEQAKLTASDATGGDRFGSDVALEGHTAIIGAPDDDDNGGQSGSAYVFMRSGATWSEQAKLAASDASSSDNFGRGVAIEGNTVVIDARLNDDNGSQSGSAYVFTRSGTMWSQQAKLTASDGAAYDEFGYTVSVSGDTAVIGSRYDDDNGTHSGSAYVFRLKDPTAISVEQMNIQTGSTPTLGFITLILLLITFVLVARLWRMHRA